MRKILMKYGKFTFLHGLNYSGGVTYCVTLRNYNTAKKRPKTCLKSPETTLFTKSLHIESNKLFCETGAMCVFRYKGYCTVLRKTVLAHVKPNCKQNAEERWRFA